MKSFLCLIIIAIPFFSCSNKEGNSIIDKFKFNPDRDSSIFYFPSDSLLFNLNAFQNIQGYYTKRNAYEVMYDLKEPSLYNYIGNGEAIRLVWLRSFENPVLIRLNNFNDTVYANIKELNLKVNENNVPRIIKDTIIVLDKEIWTQAVSILQDNNFWSTPVEDTSFLKSNVKDGTPWLLECRLRSKYHFINRWDGGSMSSKELNLYASELINIGERYVQMKSRR